MALLAFAAFTTPVNAQDGKASSAPTPGKHMRVHTVTQSIVSACTNKSAGDACKFANGKQTIKGICSKSQSGKLFCRPANPPPMIGAPAGKASPKDTPVSQ
ncbi:MAG TPA: hypothetical protein VMU16_03230 [Candidatus Binataceae bacterium]|nr:hypothetical protein [Candidatus Binataceae bacterium]